MRTFVVLCLVAVACAEQSGYNYQPVGHATENVPDYAGAQGVSNNAAATNAAPAYAGSPQGDLGEASQDVASYAPQGELDKEFYTYTADENDFNDAAASNPLGQSIRQALRVIFIKGPENKGLEDAALSLAQQAAERKTAIYVLNKQADLGNLANQLNNINSNSNKPEVHFVKYRTPEDAANAQRAIQGQYDALGGPSQAHDGGVARVLNFASQAPAHFAASSPSASYFPPSSVAQASAPSASYLPASIFRRLRS